MFKNIGLKLEVVVFVLLLFGGVTYAYFWFFNDFTNKINLQNGPESVISLVEEKIKVKQYKLIQNSFKIQKELRFIKGRNSITVNASGVKSEYKYAVLNKNGMVLNSTFSLIKSYRGVPVVDRALTNGVATDGYFTIDGSIYVFGVAPFTIKGKSQGDTFVALSVTKLKDMLTDFNISFPVKFFENNKEIFSTKKSRWENLLKSEVSKSAQQGIDTLVGIKNKNVYDIDEWNKLMSFSLNTVELEHSNITAVGLISFLPEYYETYKNFKMFLTVVAALALFAALLFTAIITHEIDKIYRNIAGDLSNLKIGEKLIVKKYSHGAGLVVSAVNHIIGLYQKHSVSNDNQNDILSSYDEHEEEEPSFEFPNISPEIVPDSEVSNSADSDVEKTEIARIPEGFELPLLDSEKINFVSKYSDEWNEYKNIKIASGGAISEKDESLFYDKLENNRNAIMEKYGCLDVIFSIENKNGKPIIKAKPVK